MQNNPCNVAQQLAQTHRGGGGGGLCPPGQQSASRGKSLNNQSEIVSNLAHPKPQL